MSIKYQLKRSKNRKTLAIKIKAKEVFVYAPMHLKQDFIEQWLMQKQNWINKHLEKQIKRIDAASVLTQKTLSILGEDVNLAFVEGQLKSNAELVDEVLSINTSRRVINVRDKQLSLIADFVKDKLTDYCSVKVQLLAKQINESFHSVSVKHVRSRWGACDSKRRLQFNLQLVTAPLWVIEYVVAHEVAHLKVMDHSRRFWQTVESIYPDYRKAETWLKENGYKLDIFKLD
ncbi:hypothetical protein AN214_01820 [Pseudoalteromonas sp. P1-9]|uniref:M48 family metallopeptidase n=1 Tax=Pseudoalteromonas sp. P1-9 TaxID=1710354 RepID=UPI0006D62A1C|nr:SprT family zinc-dependent metalloprotease [Pseudoalteromonas sp. P1-9]KPV96011.1 hypothetical protein AN214_01820 [Pseudoalteromonas sp. P1-9]